MCGACNPTSFCARFRHNYHGWLGTAISAHFCAAIPNFKVLEVDVDDVPWKDTVTTGTILFVCFLLFARP